MTWQVLKVAKMEITIRKFWPKKPDLLGADLQIEPQKT